MRALVIPILLWIAVLPAIVSAIEVSGDVWGTWSPVNNPYEVVGLLRVPPESTLVMEPGVFVNFKVHCKFIIDENAVLHAVGTEQDSIIFTAENHAIGWRGIRFIHAKDTSQLSYCRLEYGRATGNWPHRGAGAIYCYYCSPTISSNTISNNSTLHEGGGISCDNSSPTIIGNTISGNYADSLGGGIFCHHSNPTVSRNVITSNSAGHSYYDYSRGGGIYCYDSSPTISDNIITGNSAVDYGGGIFCGSYSSPIISGNFISNNTSWYAGGGICCRGGSTPAIRDNTIKGNYASDFGGGISCELSDATISNNTISENVGADFGGGVYCEDSSPTISGNTITGNSGAYAGGLAITRCSGTIVDNFISGNWAGSCTDGHGGGLCCYSSDLVISNNVIRGNNSFYGGGLVFMESSPIIDHCLITSNGAESLGAAIYCVDASPTFVNNTISGNITWEGQAGGIYSQASNLTVLNTILWGDSAAAQPFEILLDSLSTLDITYSDIQGGWSGQGNIDADPIFAGPYNKDFYLRWHSPCIDAGDPDPQYNDPDGTRNDIGARYFNQDVAGIVELYPHDTLIVIPPEGGDIIYDGWVFNFLGRPGSADIWTYAFVPEIGQYGPLDLYESVRIPADSLGKNQITQHVPGVAPQGDYVFVAYVGNYPSTIIDSSCFYFTKTGSVAGGIADWQSLKGWFAGGLASKESGLPTHYALCQNYPNPFNATTIINYQLPVDGYVKLEIFNLFGQRLATLVDFRQQGGNRSVIWDASRFSSGVYFYRLTAGECTFTRKMVLSR